MIDLREIDTTKAQESDLETLTNLSFAAKKNRKNDA